MSRSTSSGLLTLLATSVFVAVVGRPISPIPDVVSTSEWYMANVVADNQQTLLPDDTRSGADDCEGAHDTPRYADDPDVMHQAANALSAADLWSGTINSRDAPTSAPFFEDYASFNHCGFCDDDAHLTGKKFLIIFLTTLGVMFVLVVLFWMLCSCCMCRHSLNWTCDNPDRYKKSALSVQQPFQYSRNRLAF